MNELYGGRLGVPAAGKVYWKRWVPEAKGKGTCGPGIQQALGAAHSIPATRFPRFVFSPPLTSAANSLSLPPYACLTALTLEHNDACSPARLSAYCRWHTTNRSNGYGIIFICPA